MELLIEKLVQYWAYPFVRYALVVGVLVALCASLLGVTLVLKRFSFIGDGLSHVAFGAMSVASVLNLINDMPLVMGITVLCAILLLGAGQNSKIKGDAAMAMLSVGALAIGYLMMNVFSTSTNLTGDVCTTLFGSTSILTLTQTEVWMCAALSVVVVLLYLFFYHKIFAVTFDESFASATGTRARVYNLILAVVTTVVIVMAMNLVGFFADLRPGDLPGYVRHEIVQKFPGRYHLCCCSLCILYRRRNHYLHPGRHTGGIHYCLPCKLRCFALCFLAGWVGRR